MHAAFTPPYIFIVWWLSIRMCFNGTVIKQRAALLYLHSRTICDSDAHLKHDVNFKAKT
jgi:hypothetical protein